MLKVMLGLDMFLYIDDGCGSVGSISMSDR